MRVNQRGWAPVNEDDPIWTEDHYDKIKPFADALAHQWSYIHHVSEQRGFERQFNFEDGFQDYEFESDEERNYYEAQRRLANELERIQIEHIEESLEKLGVRMMRTYEHWNEDERYMEMMENRGY